MTDTLLIENHGIAVDELPVARDMVPTDRRLLPAPIEEIERIGALIQSAGAFVNRDLRQDAGACVAVAYMAALHGTDPIMTASKAFLVNGRLAFEAQYISALVRQHIDEPFDITFQGAGAQRFCTVVGKVKGKALTYNSPILGQIKPKNSSLWLTDPDQQQGGYYSVRAWARRHMPHVLLGVYAIDELQQVAIRDVTPRGPNVFDDDAPDLESLEHVEVTEDDDALPFEPSGGVGTVNGDPTGTAPDRTAGANEQEPVEDDPLEWYEGVKTRLAGCADQEAVADLWRVTRANHKKLHEQSPTDAADLKALFGTRGKELKPRG